MLTCLFENKRICSLDLKDTIGNYKEDEVINLKKAGELNRIICEDCKSPIFLRAGNSKIPHFAHKKRKGIECHYYEFCKGETIEHRTAKSILYNHFKRVFPNSSIQLEYYHTQIKRRSDLMIFFEDNKKLAIEFQRLSTRLSEWDSRHDDYLSLNISDIWFLSYEENKVNIQNQNLSFFNKNIVEYGKFDKLFFLNVKKQEIVIIKKTDNFENFIHSQIKFYKRRYKLEKVIIDRDGNILTDLEERFKIFQSKFKKRKEINRKNMKLKIQREDSFSNVSYGQDKEIILESPVQTVTDEANNVLPKTRKFLRDENEFRKWQLKAKEIIKKNPIGPWYDDKKNKIGYCEKCNEVDNDFIHFYGSTNSGLCRKCRYEQEKY